MRIVAVFFSLVAVVGLLAQAPMPRVVAFSDVDVPLVSAPAVKRLTDSLRLVEDAMSRFCATASAPAYVKRACGTLLKVRRGFDALYGTQFTIRPDGPVWVAGYASGVNGFPVAGQDTVTVCAKVHLWDHSERLAWPPVRVRLVGDSAILTERWGNPLQQMCERSFLAGPWSITTGRDSIPVTWSGRWVTIDGRRVFRPVFEAPTLH